MPEGNASIVKSTPQWSLPMLAVTLASLPLILIGLPTVDWKVLVPIVGIALVLFGSLVPPDFLILFALVGFLGANMPIVNQGGVLTGFRWVMLFAMAIGFILRDATQTNCARAHPMYFSLVCFVFYAALSGLFSVNGFLTLLKAGAFGSLLLAVVLYGRLESQHESGSSCKLVEQFYWCAALVAAGCILTVLHFLPPSPGYFEGPFGNPNSLAAFISLVGPVLLLKLVQSLHQSPVRIIVCAALGLVLLVFLLMSRSRTGMVATFLACSWWLFFSYRKIFVLFVGGALLSAVVMWMYFPGYVQSLNQTYVQKGNSYVLLSRAALLQDSWDAAKESPLVGAGFGVTKGYSEDWEFGYETGDAGREKMNSFLALVEEVGIVGATLLVLPIVWVLVRVFRRLMLFRMFHSSTEEFWILLTLSACLVGGLADASGEAWLTAAGFYSAVMFWLVFGVLAARLTVPFRVPQ